MEILANLILVLLQLNWFPGVFTLPTHEIDSKSDLKYASTLSREIAIHQLKDSMDIDTNNVYSPIGISTIVAVLAEAADGKTYTEFNMALKAPLLKTELRQSFQNILSKLQTSETAFPALKSWLYVYRNQTIRPDFKEIVSHYYCVNVKDINQSPYSWDESYAPQNPSATVSTVTNSKDVIGFETLKALKNQHDNNNKIKSKFESAKGSSKFDKYVHDKQYVEVSVIREEITREQLKQSQTKISTPTDDEKKIEENHQKIPDNENLQLEETTVAVRENNAKDKENEWGDLLNSNVGPNKSHKTVISQPNLAHFLKSQKIDGARSLFGKDDIVSALSATSIVDEGSKTKMLLFNGLYYQSGWKFSSQVPQSNYSSGVFYLSSNQTVQTPFIHFHGKHFFADLKSYNACAVAINYENKRFSLLVVIPKNIEGLHNLLENLDSDIFTYFMDVATEKALLISMPKFQMEETSTSKSMLKSLGLQKMFKKGSADLSSLSDNPDLHVDEVLQFVSVRVDQGDIINTDLDAENNTIKAINTYGEERFDVNRPFLYFVLDTEEDVVIVSGKIIMPLSFV